jgi:hypothetical protein
MAAEASACAAGVSLGAYRRVQPAGPSWTWAGLASAEERRAVEVKIGIQSVPREIVVETNSSYEEIQQLLAAAVTESAIFVITDEKGGKVMVPGDKIAYLELGSLEPRRIGFGNTL